MMSHGVILVLVSFQYSAGLAAVGIKTTGHSRDQAFNSIQLAQALPPGLTEMDVRYLAILVRECLNGNLSNCEQALRHEIPLDPKVRRDVEERRALLRAQQQQAKERRDAEKRASALRIFNGIVDACRQYSIAACDEALRSSSASQEDKQKIFALHSAAQQFQTNVVNCQNLVLSACDAALRFSNVSDELRSTLMRLRADALARQREAAAHSVSRESETKRSTAANPAQSPSASVLQPLWFIVIAMAIVGVFFLISQRLKQASADRPLWKQVLLGVAIAVIGAALVKMLGLSDGVSLVAFSIAGLLVITIALFS